MWVGVLSACLLLTDPGAVPPAPPQDGTFQSLFDAAEYRYPSGDKELPFQYRIFVPTAGANHGKWPMIVWLHGHGEGGNDNSSQLRWIDRLVMRPPWIRERFPFYVLAVQCGEESAGWTMSSAEQVGMLEVVAALLEQQLAERPIDAERIYLAGVSSGGTACWELAVRYPGRFAAVTPFASCGTNRPELNRLVGVPVWAFHSVQDRHASVKLVRRTVSRLRELGGTVELTEMPTGDHDCWTAAFARYDVLAWMLRQRRGHSAWWNSPRTFVRHAHLRHFLRDRRWWQIGLAVAISIASIIAAARSVRRYLKS